MGYHAFSGEGRGDKSNIRGGGEVLLYNRRHARPRRFANFFLVREFPHEEKLTICKFRLAFYRSYSYTRPIFRIKLVNMTNGARGNIHSHRSFGSGLVSRNYYLSIGSGRRWCPARDFSILFIRCYYRTISIRFDFLYRCGVYSR